MKFDEKRYKVADKSKLCMIYFLLKNKEVVYVGQTTHGIIRAYQHKNKDFDEVAYIQYREDELDKKEDEYILKYRPIYNKTLNRKYTIKRIRAEMQPYLKGCVRTSKIRRLIVRLGFDIKNIDGVEFLIEEDYKKFMEVMNDVSWVQRHLDSL